MTLKLKPNDNGGNFEPVPEGLHLAICIGVWDVGLQWNDKWGIAQPKGVVMWELPDDRIDVEKDGKKVNLPMSISKRYTLSLNKKANLRRDLEGWRGRSFAEEEAELFDLNAILGKGCQLNIVHEKKGDKTYANIQSIVGLPKGMKLREPENPLRFFEIEPDSEIIIPDTAPEWIQNLIRNSEEYKLQEKSGEHFGNSGQNTQQPEDGHTDDDLPF